MKFPSISIGRPQMLAGLLLLALLGQSLWLVRRRPFTDSERAFGDAGHTALASAPLRRDGIPVDTNVNTVDSILVFRVARLAHQLNRAFAGEEIYSPYAVNRSEKWIYRLPFLGFGLWLGGGLWWVARRIFGNTGGYIALALYCFSPAIVDFSSRVNAEIVAAWGLFGIVYTAIGVAHTLYAPPERWRPRTILLGVAVGLTASAHLLAAIAGLVLSCAFVIYLAPGRRRAGLGILAVSSGIGAVIFWGLHGFSLMESWAVFSSGRALRIVLKVSAALSLGARSENLILTAVTAIALAALILWRRAQYFGNTAPLLTAALLLPLQTRTTLATPWIWGLPFLAVFVAGLSTDLLEYRHRLRIPLSLALLANAGLCLIAVAGLGALRSGLA